MSCEIGSLYKGETAIGRGSRFPLVISTSINAYEGLTKIQR